jgi:hypothetical protein
MKQYNMDIKLEALKKRYEADILESKATLEVYLNNAAGIGEHPQIIEEMDKLFCKLADAEGKLESLNGFELKENQDYK